MSFISQDSEEITQIEDNQETQEKIIKNIFLSCDTNDTGFVAVTDLIQFISQYVSNTTHLSELWKLLDSDSKNQLINIDTFVQIMTKWTGTFSEINSNSEIGSLYEPENANNLTIATPRNSLGVENADFMTLNLSNISSYSYAGNSVGGESVALQDRIDELEHQNKKLSDLLSRIRQQLISSEEQNVALQNDLDRVSKRLLAEQRANETLQKARKDNEDLAESSQSMIKQQEETNRLVMMYKKENANLKIDNIELQTENQSLADKVHQLKTREKELIQNNGENMENLMLKETELVALEEKLLYVKESSTEKDDHINQLNDKIESLKQDKKSLEKKLGAQNEQYMKKLKATTKSEGDPSKSLHDSTRSSEDDMFWKTAMPQHQISLQDELSKATNSASEVETCDHVVQFIQYKNEIKTLQVELKKYEIKSDNIETTRYEIESLKKELIDCQEEIQKNCAEQLENYRKEIQEVRNKVIEYETDIHVLRGQLDSTKSELELRQNEANVKIRELEAEKRKLQNVEERNVNKLNTLNSQLEDIRGMCIKYQGDIEELKLQKELIGKELAEKINDNNELCKITEEIKQNFKNLKKSFIECNNNINLLQYEQKEVLKLKVKKENENLDLLKTISNLKESLDGYKKKCECVSEQLSEITTLNNKYEQQLTETEKRGIKSCELNENLETMITNLRETIKKHEIDKNDWSKREEEFSHRICRLQTEVECLKHPIECINCEDLRSELSELAKETNKLKLTAKKPMRIELLYNKIEKLDEQLFQEKNRNETLANQVKVMSDEMKQVKTTSENLIADLKHITSDKLRLQAKIKKLTHTIAGYELKLQTNKKSLKFDEQVKMDNEELKKKLHDLEVQNGLLYSSTDKAVKRLQEKRNMLCSNTRYTLEQWQEMRANEEFPVKKIMGSNLNEVSSQTSPLESEIFLLDYQIQLTSRLLRKFANLKPEAQLSSTPISCVPIRSSEISPIVTAAPGPCGRAPSENELELELELESELPRPVVPDVLRLARTMSPDSPADGSQLRAGSKSSSSESLPDADLGGNASNETYEIHSPRQFRSKSDGGTPKSTLEEVIVCPSLQESDLDSLGLLWESPKDRLTEEETESRFQKLALAFTIDAITLADRRDRQRRQRDQAEKNMVAEVARLTSGIHLLNPLCVDAETTELVRGLLSQLDVILQAARRVSTSAEVFGAIQQEWRLSESVNLMQNHLRNLKLQKEALRKNLQCTQKMLQEPAPGSPQPKSVPPTRRRASIAIISQLPGPDGPGRAPRRVSAGGESSLRWESRSRPDFTDRTSTGRCPRPSRQDFDADLVQITEGPSESAADTADEAADASSDFATPADVTDEETTDFATPIGETTAADTTFRNRLVGLFRNVECSVERKWNALAQEGVVHEFCCLGALICFSLCTIIVGNMMIEIEYARRGQYMQRISWSFGTWKEILEQFVTVRQNAPAPI